MLLIFEDFIFYWSHRFLHKSFVYKRVHKQHHEYYNPVAISCMYAHWFEFIVGNLFPIYMSLYVFQEKLHIITYSTYLFWSLTETHETHSGYQFPISPFNWLPFSSEIISRLGLP